MLQAKFMKDQKIPNFILPAMGGSFANLTAKDNLKAISEIVIEDKNLRSSRIDYLLPNLN